MTEVTCKNYIQHAMRTNSDTVGTYDVHPDLIHGALGLADELSELRQAIEKFDRTNVLEEVSDLAWFSALMAQHLQIEKFEDAFCTAGPISEIMYYLDCDINEVVSGVKRAYAYGKPLDVENLAYKLHHVVTGLNSIAVALDSTLVDVLQLNINKLATRYPDKFTPEQANNRDTERERETLERSAG